MKSINNYINERLNPRHLGSTPGDLDWTKVFVESFGLGDINKEEIIDILTKDIHYDNIKNICSSVDDICLYTLSFKVLASSNPSLEQIIILKNGLVYKLLLEYTPGGKYIGTAAINSKSSNKRIPPKIKRLCEQIDYHKPDYRLLIKIFFAIFNEDKDAK
jgi:hypothetical protein